MAASPWVARIDGISAVGNATDMQVVVSYWDAADVSFTNQLAARTFNVASGTTTTDLVAAIVQFGALERTLQARIAAAQARVGTTINIP